MDPLDLPALLFNPHHEETAMTTKENRTVHPVNGIGPGATIGARKLAERRAEKLARQRRSAGPAMPLVELTAGELEALRMVEYGADVYVYVVARDLRAVQRKAPELVSIGKARMYRGEGIGRMPYFGATATTAGRKLLRKAGPADWHGAAQRELDAAAMGEELDAAALGEESDS